MFSENIISLTCFIVFVFQSKKYNFENALKDLSKKGLALFLIVNL